MNLLQAPKQRILVLGGTNFVGKTLLDYISKVRPHAQVYCINRGKVYWNNQARRQHKYEHFFADRKDHKDTQQMIVFLNEKLKITQWHKWKGVVDFSGFRWRDMQSTLKPLKNLCQRYIFISSDSIYNNRDPCLTALTQSCFDIQSQYSSLRKDSQVNDKYGYDKLKCQVYIKRRCQVPTYCLRLPDVIGPYDNTERFWATLEWIKASRSYPIPLSQQDQSRKLAFVYSKDVCRFILQLIDVEKPQTDFINMGFRQNPTFEQFIRLIAKKLRLQPVFKAVRQQSNNCFPSTQFGHVSIEKLLNTYEFVPTSLQQAIQESVEFFNQKAPKYESERKQMTKMFYKKIKSKGQ